MTNPQAGQRQAKKRLDYDLISGLVPDGARVLDLGCGDGQLLAQLIEGKGCQGRGIEIREQAVRECIRRGVAVYHGDMLEGMTHHRDGSFDLVILSQTLQQSSHPLEVIHEMLRVGRNAIISFPNFGYWRIRLQLLLTGRMPRTDLLPYDWFSSPNVHLCTVADFRDLCEQQNLERMNEMFLVPPSRQISGRQANWRAALAIIEIRRRE